MSGTYHIIHYYAQYTTRRVACYETGRYHRHKTHEEKAVSSACGKILVNGRDQYCNIAIANPGWSYDWCHECVKAFPWTDDAKGMWATKGIEIPDD